MNFRERLIELIAEYGLERREVAELLHVKREIVDHWLLPPEGKSHEMVPEMAVELLELKLKDRNPQRGDGN